MRWKRRSGRGLTAQLGLSVDLPTGYVAHEERKAPRIPESGYVNLECIKHVFKMDFYRDEVNGLRSDR